MAAAIAPVRIHASSFFIWGLLAVIVGLGGRYLGGPLVVVRLAVLFAPVISIGWLVVSVAALRYRQEFENDHPAKGSYVHYRLICSNEYPIPICTVRLRLVLGRSEADVQTEFVQLGIRDHIVLEHRVLCGFRGVYTVGLTEMTMCDPLGLGEYRLDVRHKTFYVMPRILQPSASLIGIARQVPGAPEPETGSAGDPSLFRELSEYRGDHDARRIVWRYYSSRGIALIRQYDSAREPGIRLLLDTRPTGAPAQPDYRCEDCTIEVAVALARACVITGTPVSFAGHGVPSLEIAAYDEAAVERFARLTVGVFFSAPASPLAYEQPRRDDGVPVVVITHLQDDELIEWVEAQSAEQRVGVIFNTAAMGARRAEEMRRFARELSATGRLCYAVEQADDLLRLAE